MDPFKDADFLTEFIQKWKEHPVLWQTKNTINKNKDAREKAKESMLAFLKTRVPNATKDTVKSKINSIRGTYRAQRVQVLASMRSGAAADSIGPFSSDKPIVCTGHKSISSILEDI